MLKLSVRSQRALMVAIGALSSLSLQSPIQAAGLEKNVLWSGKYQGFGGAAVSSVNNSEAIYFNPAGLGFLENSGDVRLNFSPTLSYFSGPVSTTQLDKDSETGFSPVGGLTSAYRLNNKIVLGAGVFASGGTNTEYDGINEGAVVNGRSESKLMILEGSVGAGIKITDEFSIGAAWRVSYATADLATVLSVPAFGSSAQLDLKDLKGMDAQSFRLGAQYQTEDYGIGLLVRTPITLSLKGKAKFDSFGGPVFTDMTVDDTTVTATFPFLVALGGDYKLTNTWTLFTEVSWANYSANQKLDITIPSTQPGAAAVTNADIQLKWKDQWVGRIGSEWQLQDWFALRAGYVITSRVTSTDRARATFTAPGIGHTFCIGSGFDFGNWDVDVAYDYSFVKGDGREAGPTPTYGGTYETKSHTFHTGVAYNF